MRREEERRGEEKEIESSADFLLFLHVSSLYNRKRKRK